MTESGDEAPGRATGEAGVSGADEGHSGHGPMGHSGAGHLLHMAPMALILLAPRLGWPLTIGLLALFGVYMYVSWRRRRGAQTTSAQAQVPRREE
ncbi:MAG: hypothetical protein ACYC5Q_09465 [Thermoleophilia bacterium]